MEVVYRLIKTEAMEDDAHSVNGRTRHVQLPWRQMWFGGGRWGGIGSSGW